MKRREDKGCTICGKQCQWLQIVPADMDTLLGKGLTDKEFRAGLDGLPQYCGDCFPKAPGA